MSFVLVADGVGDVTLRQETAVGLLLAGVIVCTVRFIERRSPAPLAVVAALVPLSITVHPAGIVAIAPLFVVTPSLYRWVRASPAAAVALFTGAGALTLTLAFVGSDVEQRALDANASRAGFSTGAVGWRNELIRYSVVALPKVDDIAGYGTPLRRGSVGWILLAVASVLVLHRRRSNPLDAIAMYTLPISLALLVVTPSKWPWHFGALLAPTALAAAVVAAALRRDERSSDSWSAHPLSAIAVLMVVIGWSWSPRTRLDPLDLRTLDWTPAFEATVVSITALAVVAPLALLVVTWARARASDAAAFGAPWRVLAWSAPLLALPLIAFTGAVFVTDAARTVGWTHSRANFTSVARFQMRPCERSPRSVGRIDAASPTALSHRCSSPDWVPPTPVPNAQRFVLGPISGIRSSTPWFSVSEGALGVFVSGELGRDDRLLSQWGRRGARGLRVIRSELVAVKTTAEQGTIIAWHFVPINQGMRRPIRDSALRMTLVNTGPPSAAVAVTAPMRYTSEPIALRAEAAETLAQPDIATFFPCVNQPALHHGIVDAPTLILSARDAGAPLRYPATAPFAGLLDLYRIVPLPLTLKEGVPPDNLVAFDVNLRIPGTVAAAPDRSTVVG